MNNSQKQELLEYYKNLLILQYNQQNGTARATIGALVDQVLGALVAQQVQDGFNVETAVGKQLDILAKYLGLQRYQQGYGNLTDNELRILIKFAILKNNNISSLEAIKNSLSALFGDEVSVVDNKNMTMRYNISSNIDKIVIDILTATDLLPRPMGVGVEIFNADAVLGFAGSELQTFDNGVFYDPQPAPQEPRTVTISCTDPDVIIKINNETTRSKTMAYGSGYTWSVDKVGYQSVSGSGTLTEDTIIDISVLKIEPSIPTATIIVNDVEQQGILFRSGTTLNYTYSVSASGYEPKTGSGSTSESLTIEVRLEFGLSIHAPQGATVTINGQQTSFLAMNPGTAYTWSVSGTGYLAAYGSGVLNEATILNVYSVSGVNATLDFNSSGYSAAYVLEGDNINYVATDTGALSYSGSKVITQNTIINIAILTLGLTPSPDIAEINGMTSNKALFETGVPFEYTVVAYKRNYNNLTISGTATQSTVVSGTFVPLTPLCFTAEQANSTVGYTQGSNINVDVKYSRDLVTWTSLSPNTNVTLTNVGDKVYFKGLNSAWCTYSGYASSVARFTMSGKIAASGNLNSILDDGDGSTISSLPNDCFWSLFYNCSALTQAPYLPAVTLGSRSYSAMFEYCTSLKYVPRVEATSLGEYALNFMFAYCSGLENGPYVAEPTSLAKGSYAHLFYSCTNLRSFKLGYKGSLSENLNFEWVYNVPSGGTMYYNGPSTGTGTSGIPSGWTIKKF